MLNFREKESYRLYSKNNVGAEEMTPECRLELRGAGFAILR